MSQLIVAIGKETWCHIPSGRATRTTRTAHCVPLSLQGTTTHSGRVVRRPSYLWWRIMSLLSDRMLYFDFLHLKNLWTFIFFYLFVCLFLFFWVRNVLPGAKKKEQGKKKNWQAKQTEWGSGRGEGETHVWQPLKNILWSLKRCLQHCINQCRYLTGCQLHFG